MINAQHRFQAFLLGIQAGVETLGNPRLTMNPWQKHSPLGKQFSKGYSLMNKFYRSTQ